MRQFYLRLSALIAIIIAIANISEAKSELRNSIVVNSDVTTHIVMPENLKLVDISTDKIIGNQCADNMVRIKPLPADSINKGYFTNNEFLGTITLIGERHIAQFDIIYDHSARNAESIFNVSYDQMQMYSNPDVSMPQSEMAKFAWAIYGSKRKFNNIRSRSNGIRGEIYNIYSIGDYFFVDFVLENKTNIEYDIDEIRVTLADKKETKATNSQMVQLSPVYTLNTADRFKKKYRQVLVLNKLTFPEEKVVNISVSEKQISGRTITISVDYSDVLNADGFDINKINDFKPVYRYIEIDKSDSEKYQNLVDANSNLNERLVAAKQEVDRLKTYKDEINIYEQENIRLADELADANNEIKRLNGRLEEVSLSLDKMEAAYKGATETIDMILAKDKSK